MAMAKSAVDVGSDGNQQLLHRISKLVSLPDFVKNAATIDAAEVAKLPQTVFADPANRKFPLHSKVATWLAQTYFAEARHLYPTQAAEAVQAKISKAAAYWGIEQSVKEAREILAHHQSDQPPALTDADYALVLKTGDKVSRQWPIHSDPNIKTAAATLFNHRHELLYQHRKVAARKILHKAAELHVDLPTEVSSYLTKAAGVGSAFPEKVAEQLAHRMLMLPRGQQELRVQTAKLAKAVAGMPGIPSAEEMEKLAAIIDRLDREQGFTKYYDQGVETPEEICFALSYEKAAAIKNSYVELTTGTVIPFEALHKLPLDKIAAAVGEDFLKAVMADNTIDIDVSRFAKIAATLPLGDAQLLERALKQAGAMPKRLSLADVAV